MLFFFFQAEDGIRDLVRSRGLGDVYKRQTDSGVVVVPALQGLAAPHWRTDVRGAMFGLNRSTASDDICLLYTSDAADERSSGDLGGRRII